MNSFQNHLITRDLALKFAVKNAFQCPKIFKSNTKFI